MDLQCAFPHVTTSGIQDLPDDILLNILLRACKGVSDNTAFHFYEVCKLWRNICTNAICSLTLKCGERRCVCPLENLSEVCKFPNLRHLHLSGVVKKDLDWSVAFTALLRCCPHLESLDLNVHLAIPGPNYTPAITVEDVSILFAGLGSALHTLVLRFGDPLKRVTAVVPLPPFSERNQLRSLSLESDAVTNVSSLLALSGLQSLSLIMDYLHDVPDLDAFPLLETFDITSWSSELDGGVVIRNCHRLKALRIYGLNYVSLGILPWLQSLDLGGSMRSLEGIESLPDLVSLSSQLVCIRDVETALLHRIANMPGLKKLHLCVWGDDPESQDLLLRLTSLDELEIWFAGPTVSWTLPSTQVLEYTWSRAPAALPQLSAPQNLKVFKCGGTVGKEVPVDVEAMTSLESLEVCHVRSITSMAHLSCLRSLSFKCGPSIFHLPPLSPTLLHLHIEHLPLNSLAPLSAVVRLQTLKVWRCSKIIAIPEIGGLTELKTLDIEMCWDLATLPALPQSLSSLAVGNCRQLCSLPPLRGLSQLVILDVSGCIQLTEIPSLRGLTRLKFLSMGGCKALTAMPSLEGLVSLHHVMCRGLGEHLRAPGIENLPFRDCIRRQSELNGRGVYLR